MKWDPEKYVQFGDYRDRPFFDLTGRIHAEAPRHVVDLGCGPGNLTATLAERWPGAQVVGLDSSPEMLAKSKVHAAAAPNLSFDLADIAALDARPGTPTSWSPTPPCSGCPATGSCCPAGSMRSSPGAWFALQVPGNFNAPSHTLMRELAESAGLGGTARRGAAPRRRGGRASGVPGDHARRRLRRRRLGDHLPAAAPGRQTPFSSGSAGPDSGRSSPPSRQTRRAEFEAEYAARLDDAYPAGRHGTVFPFRRTSRWRRKPVGGVSCRLTRSTPVMGLTMTWRYGGGR